MILLLNVAAILSFITSLAFWVLSNVVLQKKYIVISGIFRLLVFTINAVILIYYYRLADFFIMILQENRKEVLKFKCAMWFVIIVIVITISLENIYLPTY